MWENEFCKVCDWNLDVREAGFCLSLFRVEREQGQQSAGLDSGGLPLSIGIIY